MNDPNGSAVSEPFTLAFGKRSHELNIRTFVEVLDGVATLSSESARAFDPGLEVGLKVGPPKEGSFEIQLFITGPQLLELAKSLFTLEGLRITTAVIGGVSALLKLRKLLKGEPPKSTDTVPTDRDSVIVQNSAGVSINVDRRILNVYLGSRPAKEALDKTFESLDADPEIDSFAVKDTGGKELFEVKHSELPAIKTADLLEPPPEERIVLDQETLHIVKPSFMSGLKWDFIFKGERISAYLKDKSFTNRIDDGERFGKGDRLVVELRIVQVWDRSLDTFVNRSYEILRVVKHESRPQHRQANLEDDVS